jgi:hypothetical protein
MKMLLTIFFVYLFRTALYAGGTLNITDFGAVAGAGTLQTVYIQAAIDSAERAGGGTVLIPPGVFLSSTIFLKDDVILEIAKNGVLKGPLLVSYYPDVIPSVRSFTDRYPQRSIIYAEGKRNIGIKGEGTLDGNGMSLDFLLNEDDKPFGVRFIGCTNVLYEGITMKNSGFWMMHNLNCDSIVMRNLKIINHNFGNGDGINIDGSRHVLVENCTVDSNDDPMVIKTTNLGEASDIEVRNCTFATYSRAIKIGTETYGPVRNVYIHDCEVKYSIWGPFGDHFAGDCGIQLSIVDGGFMENVVVENIQIKGVQTPIFIRLGDRGDPFEPGGPRPPMGSMKNIILRNITAEAATGITSSITGIPGFPVKNITLQNIELTVPGGEGPVPVGYTVPENINSRPAFDMFGEYLPAYGLYIRHADSLVLDHVCVTVINQDERPEIHFEDTGRVEVTPCLVTSLVNNKTSGIKLFPNPASEMLQVELEGQNIQAGNYLVKDVLGRNQLSGTITGKDIQIDVSGLASGLYFINTYDTRSFSVSGMFLKR